MNKTFTALNTRNIVGLIDATKQQLTYAAPGINNEIAAAIVRCKQNNPGIKIEIIIDNDPDAIRFGYGSFEGINTLILNKIKLRYHNGLRIGLISTELVSYIFNPSPQIVEEEPKDSATPNAIILSEHEVAKILKSTQYKDEPGKDKPISEIGNNVMSKEEMKNIQKDLEIRPPIKPNLFRQMNVINSVFQLVETHLTGARVQAKTFTLTPQDLGIKDKEIAKRIRASYKIIENEAIVELSELEEMHYKIKEHVLHTNPQVWHVIKYENLKNFDDAIIVLKEGD